MSHLHTIEGSYGLPVRVRLDGGVHGFLVELGVWIGGIGLVLIAYQLSRIADAMAGVAP